MLKTLFTSLFFAATIAFLHAPDVVSAEMGDVQQTSDEGDIKVTVALQNIATVTWGFEVTMESHSKSLTDDLTKSSVLIAEGKQYLPLGWEGAAPGGHHRKGLLRFKAIVPQPRKMELQLRLVGDTSPRSFKWLLK